MRDEIVKEAKIELARRSLWYYCKALFPDFYTDDRKFLKDLCDTLQKRPLRLMLNMPPRCFKSLTLALYETWLFGQDKKTKVLTVSYNDLVAGRFSQLVRNTIQASTLVRSQIVFSDVFPDVRIKKGDGAQNIWALEGQFFSYKGSGLSASLTGMGANVGVIDDPVKNAREAFDARTLESHWEFYTDTFLSRLETGAQIIINHTRWSEEDLCGRILRDTEDDWTVFSVQMEQPDGNPLCPRILTKDEMEFKKTSMSPEIWMANYQQQIVRTKNSLFEEGLAFVSDIPEDLPVTAILDPADKGKDNFAAAAFVDNGGFYDVKGTFVSPSELSELQDKLARWILDQNVKRVLIESNNVGNYFMKTFRKREDMAGVVFKPFVSSTSKESRILSAAWFIQEKVRFHRSLKNSEFYKEVAGFKKTFTANAHDDCVEVLSNIYHRIASKGKSIVGKRL